MSGDDGFLSGILGRNLNLISFDRSVPEQSFRDDANARFSFSNGGLEAQMNDQSFNDYWAMVIGHWSLGQRVQVSKAQSVRIDFNHELSLPRVINIGEIEGILLNTATKNIQ